jgi:hypothetical protein
VSRFVLSAAASFTAWFERVEAVKGRFNVLPDWLEPPKKDVKTPFIVVNLSTAP